MFDKLSVNYCNPFQINALICIWFMPILEKLWQQQKIVCCARNWNSLFFGLLMAQNELIYPHSFLAGKNENIVWTTGAY